MGLRISFFTATPNLARRRQRDTLRILAGPDRVVWPCSPHNSTSGQFADGPLPGSRRLLPHHRNVGQVAVLLVVVQAVADDEDRWNLEPLVAHVHRYLLNALLAHEGTDLEARRFARLQVFEEVEERQAGIDDVLDEQDVAPRDLEVEVLQDPHDAGGPGGGAVAGHGHEVELERQADLPGQVTHKNEGALEDTDQEQVTTPVILGDALGHVPDL